MATESVKTDRMLLRTPDVCRAIGIGPRTLDRWVASGAFPPPEVRVGGRFRGWTPESIHRWIDQQAASK